MSSDGFNKTKTSFADAWAKDLLFSFAIDEVVYDEESDFQSIQIVDTKAFGRMLILDGHLQTATDDEAGYHELITHVGLCRQGAPDKMKVLIIGGGDGGAAREVLKHDFVTRLDLVDIDAAVMNAARTHLPTLWPPSLDDDARFSAHAEDGVNFLSDSTRGAPLYDHIIIDASDPVGPGTVLYSDAFYKSVHDRLSPQGSVSVQAGSAHYFPQILQCVFQGLKKAFQNVHVYECFTKIYPGGVWNLALATKDGSLPTSACPTRLAALDSCEFYDEAAHRAAFALAPRVRKVLTQPAPSLSAVSASIEAISD